MALVDVLVDVLDRANRSTDLDIDMGLEFPRQERVVGNDPTIIKYKPSLFGLATIVPASVYRILVFHNYGLFGEIDGETFRALTSFI